MDDHLHGPDGHVVEPPAADVAETELVTDASVRIAEIERDKEIALARIAAKVEESHDETDVEALKAEVRAMREILDRLAPPPAEPEPEPEPEPVVIAAPEPEPTDDLAPPEAETEHHHAPKAHGLGMWQ